MIVDVAVELSRRKAEEMQKASEIMW
jgi:hypothetical protein